MFIQDYSTVLFTAAETEALFSELLEEVEWKQDNTACYGKEFLPWTNVLLDIKQYLEDKLDIHLDYVLLKLNVNEIEMEFYSSGQMISLPVGRQV